MGTAWAQCGRAARAPHLRARAQEDDRLQVVDVAPRVGRHEVGHLGASAGRLVQQHTVDARHVGHDRHAARKLLLPVRRRHPVVRRFGI
eukprot:3175898-Prymnesium_polylepis.1